MAHKQTAGRDNLGELAPTFAALNDDVLFGQVWSREGQMPARQRSLITCASLMSQGLFPQLEAHLRIAKANGVAKQETGGDLHPNWPSMRAGPRHGRPSGCSRTSTPTCPTTPPDAGLFPAGLPTDGPNFTGHAWLHMLTGPDNPCQPAM
ncbi:carboxymuconolactone decarboxylase family protein [Propionibacterium freudenreichii]|uniref:carboxymuconolactone decarboxylase family protein n=1 Tax=Propionibacterium freudenreichii TaxID=1744 RepID=UPI002550F5AC|nr:carboxymuconolactone decarboxylase family protein [Propionibacterium freudenreichii]